MVTSQIYELDHFIFHDDDHPATLYEPVHLLKNAKYRDFLTVECKGQFSDMIYEMVDIGHNSMNDIYKYSDQALLGKFISWNDVSSPCNIDACALCNLLEVE